MLLSSKATATTLLAIGQRQWAPFWRAAEMLPYSSCATHVAFLTHKCYHQEGLRLNVRHQLNITLNTAYQVTHRGMTHMELGASQRGKISLRHKKLAHLALKEV